jgi:hypothetical protein
VNADSKAAIEMVAVAQLVTTRRSGAQTGNGAAYSRRSLPAEVLLRCLFREGRLGRKEGEAPYEIASCTVDAGR